MLEFVFDLPLMVTGPAIIGLLCLFALVGLWFVRRYILPHLHIQEHDSHFIGTIVHSVIVFYGLAVALIAVNVSESYTDVDKIVAGEATAIVKVYRDVSCYPDPIRPQLQGELRDYVKYVIEVAWPMQRRGQMPPGGVELMNRFQSTLVGFEPETEGQKVLHEEALRAYNELIGTRGLRIVAVHSGLPAVMWIVIVAGACIGLSAAFFFRVEDAKLHGILVLLLAIFVGVVIFMILSMDRPFRGDLGLSSEPYQLIYDHLMKAKP